MRSSSQLQEALPADSIGCYAIVRDAAAAPVTRSGHGWTPVYKAYHRLLCCHAALRIIPAGIFPSNSDRDHAATLVGQAARLRHPNLATVLPPEIAGDSFLYATEFCAGETLAERLAQTGPLPEREALSIARQISAVLKAVLAAGLPAVNLSPASILLASGRHGNVVRLLDLGLPPDPEAMRDAGFSPEIPAPAGPSATPLDEEAAAYSLGNLLYCARAGLDQWARVTALPPDERVDAVAAAPDAEPETARIFQRTFTTDSSEKLHTIAEIDGLIETALRAPPRPKRKPKVVEPPPAPPPAPTPTLLPEDDFDVTVRHLSILSPPLVEEAGPEAGFLSIPAQFLAAAQPGNGLTLEGAGNHGARFFSDPCFWIGRSATAAHLVTQFYPPCETSAKLTRMLSRIHVTVRYEEGRFVLFDGDGIRPSGNGSTFAGAELSAESPCELSAPGDLCLASEFTVRVLPLAAAGDDTPNIGNLADWKGVPGGVSASGGAVLFIPVTPCERGAAVWLLSSAPFWTSDASPLNFEPDPETPPAGLIRHWNGCFWIEARSGGQISIDGHVIGPSEIVPLISGQAIETGGSLFTARVT